MRKNTVRVIKRGETDKAENPQFSVDSSNSEKDVRMSVAATVGKWISEHRANSQAEAAASVGRIAAWNVMPGTF